MAGGFLAVRYNDDGYNIACCCHCVLVVDEGKEKKIGAKTFDSLDFKKNSIENPTRNARGISFFRVTGGSLLKKKSNRYFNFQLFSHHKSVETRKGTLAS
jgi:hypothetical protein